MAEKSKLQMSVHSDPKHFAEHVREITCGFFVFCLLFVQKSSEGDNLCVDALFAYGSAFSARVISIHDAFPDLYGPEQREKG